MANQIFKKIQKTTNRWYLLLIAGLILVITGIWTFTSPTESYFALSILFSVSFLISGIMESIFSITNRAEIEHWKWSLGFGIITAIVGGVLLMNSGVSMLTLALYVGFLILFRSTMAITWSINLKNYAVLNWGNLFAIGIVGVILSLILIFNPVLAGFTIVFWTGLALLVSGGFSIYLATRLRKLNEELETVEKTA